MPSSLLQAIVSGNPLDLPGLGPKDKGLTILFPLSMGGTVNDLANALNVPVHSILAVNPGLRADSPLGVSQVVDLPEDHLDQIMRNVSVSGDRAYVSSPPSTPSESATTPERYDVNAPNDGVNAIEPALRSVIATFDTLNRVEQNLLFPVPGEQQADRWNISITPVITASNAGQSLDMPMPVVSVSQPSSVSVSNQVPAQAAEPQTIASTMPAPNVDPSKVFAVASVPHQGESEGALSFTRVANVVVPAAQDRQRYPDMPPPPPMDDSRFAALPIRTAPTNSGISIIPPTVMNALDLPADRHPMTLQAMALLLAAQAGAGTSAPIPSQPSPFVDPQALAALVANMRGTKVIDLGAGRSMQFSLVDDRMRRVDPIGQDNRPSVRRTGDGLDEVRISRPSSEDVEQTDEQREQGRRRRAAIAAMRRRRRPRTRRCRYWHGARRDLCATGNARYPKRVDFAEFRGRRPPRYMWNVGGDER
jgi:hypothetical protein